jgi:hypothetical protein
MVKIIVARYNEDISWTKQFPNVTIFNKGTPLGLPNEIMMENVGREGHTYYKYIYDNYDSLDDYTILLQGKPFDHSPNIIKNISTILNDQHRNYDFKFLSEWIPECRLSGCIYHKGLPLREVYHKLFSDRPSDLTIRFGAGAQFIVSRAQILKRPREFYLQIVKLLEYSINPIEGFVIERFHGLVFS